VEVKRKLFTSITESRTVKYENVFNSSVEFNTLLDGVEKQFVSLNNKCDPKFTGLLLLEGYYLAHLQQDIKKGYTVIDKAVNRGISTNYNLVHFDSKAVRNIEEKVAIGASGEQSDFHQIILASSNVRLFLGYEVAKILKQDLSIILPEP